jgi:hypothetical protein
VVREIAYQVGEPEEVDLKSLEGFGLVRIKLSYRDAKHVRGETQVYFNKESRGIRWEIIEDDREKSGNTSKFDRLREDEEEDEDNEDGEFLEEYDKGVHNSKEGASANTNINKQGGKEGTIHHKQKGQQAGLEDEQPKKDVLMAENNVTDNTQNNEGGSAAIQDKSDKMKEDKKDKEVKLIEEEEDLIQTQHSSTAACEKDGEGEEMCEEELVDYDEDHAIAEKIEMAKLEKKIESRAHMLLDRAAVNIPMEGSINAGGEETEKVNSTPSTDEEID